VARWPSNSQAKSKPYFRKGALFGKKADLFTPQLGKTLRLDTQNPESVFQRGEEVDDKARFECGKKDRKKANHLKDGGGKKTIEPNSRDKESQIMAGLLTPEPKGTVPMTNQTQVVIGTVGRRKEGNTRESRGDLCPHRTMDFRQTCLVLCA